MPASQNKANLSIKGDEMWRWRDGTEFGYNNWASAEQVVSDKSILKQTKFHYKLKNFVIKGIRKQVSDFCYSEMLFVYNKSMTMK